MSVTRMDSCDAVLPDLGEQAGKWLCRFIDLEPDPDDPLSAPERRDSEFLSWVTHSPQHLRIFLDTCETYYRLGYLDRTTQIDITALLKEVRASERPMSATIIHIPEPARLPRSTHFPITTPKGAFWASAAILAALIVILLLVNVTSRKEVIAWTKSYTTQPGEHRTFNLPDSSTITLTGASHVEVSFTGKSRETRLLAGEALFSVHHENRPFIVHVGDINIHDLGTEFSVKRSTSDTKIAVVTGKVQLTRDAPDSSTDTQQTRAALPAALSRTLSDGDSIDLSDHGDFDIQQGASKIKLERGQLYFFNATVEEIVNEFNHYIAKHFVIVDAEIATLRTSGYFPSPDPDKLIEMLRDRLRVQVLPADPNDPNAIRLGRGS